MLPATHGHASGTGPPARRSLLGSARTSLQHKTHAFSEVNGNGGGVREANGHGIAQAGRNGLGHGNALTSTVPQKRKLGMGGGGGVSGSKVRRDEDGGRDRRREGEKMGMEMGAEEGDEIRCRCGSSLDDGFSIACDVCGRWCHAACFAISKESVPEEWKCWLCAPQNHLDLPPPANGPANRRRRASVSGRRASTVEASPPLSTVDDLEDERTQYVLIDNDIVPDVVTQRKLRAYAAQWRGVSALEPEPPPHAEGHTPFVFGAPPPAHPTLLHPCAPSSSSSASASAYAVLPPTYALHAAAPAPPRTLLARYPSTITPTGVYLRAPTNGYAHAGAPKRFVHLVGPPLDVALDARAAGGRGRWVRSGCWPNAEVRAFVCGGAGAGEGRRHAKEDGVRVREREMDGEGEPRTHFGIFATRALREGEEIVVGWEWDDANAVHRVAEVAGNGGPPNLPTPTQRHLIAQLANILHALGADAECACTGTSIAVPTSSGPAAAAPAAPAAPAVSLQVPPAREKGSGSGSEKDQDDGTEDEGRGEVGERACVIRAMERVVFPPVALPAHGLGGRDAEEMEVDIVGEDIPRSHPSSSSSARTLLPSTSASMSASHASSSASTSLQAPTASTSTPTRKPKRLAGPGVPPPSPEVPQHDPRPRWGPLIGASRGVRAVEQVRGSGGWSGVVLDHADVRDRYGEGYLNAGEGWYSSAGAREMGGYGYGHASSSNADVNKAYAVVERAGGWDVLHETAASSGRGWETEEEEDVDVVGDADNDKPVRSDRTRGKTRRRDRERDREREGKRERLQEAICPPKMRKRWKAGRDGAEVHAAPPSRAEQGSEMVARNIVHAPPRTDKGKGKARAVDEAMEVDIDGIDTPGDRLPLHPPRVPPPPLFRPPLGPALSVLSAGPSPSASFARLSLTSPYPGTGGPRPSWFSLGAGADVDVLAHGDAPDLQARNREQEGMPAFESTSAAADVSASPSDTRTPPPAALDPSPRVRFVEPVAAVPPEDAEVDLPPDVPPDHDDQHNDALLDVGAEEPYRPSPESPSPAPESDEEVQVTPEIAPRILGEEDASSVPAEPEVVPSERGASPIAIPPPSTGSSSPAAPAPKTLAREPSPPPTALPVQPPVVKVAFKEWQARRKLERAKEEEVAQEREREKQKEQESEREREQREKDAQGEDKENEVVPAKPEDGLSRILDGIRRSAVSDKPPTVEPARDVEMADAVPFAEAPPAATALAPDELPPRGKGTPLSMTAFVVTGNEHLSPLTVSSVVESRTPSPRLPNAVKREPSPLAAPSTTTTNGVFSQPRAPIPTALFSVAPVPTATFSAPAPTPGAMASTFSTSLPSYSSVLHSPKAPRFPSPSFTSNGVYKTVAPFPKHFGVALQSPSPSFTTNASSRPKPARPPSPPQIASPSQFRFHARAPSQEEGEIPSSPPLPPRPARPTPQLPPRTSPFAASTGPPTQPRSHRMPPSAPKALREAQNPNAVGGGATSARGGALRFNGMVPQTMPASLLDAGPRSNHRGGKPWRKRRG